MTIRLISFLNNFLGKIPIYLTSWGVFVLYPRLAILKPEGLKDLARSLVASLLRMMGREKTPRDPSPI
jgi:hypothetical protein